MDNFFVHYLIYQLSLTDKTNINQLTSIISGKRTASMLYICLKNRWANLFAYPYKNTKRDLEQIFMTLKKQKVIEGTSKDFYLSQKGHKLAKAFINQYPFLKQPISLDLKASYQDYWLKIMFINQVVSEYAYENTNYLPLFNDFNQQQWLKKWIFHHDGLKNLKEAWVKENLQVFKEMPTVIYRDLLVNCLSGHNKIGMTKAQACLKFNLTPSQYDFYILYASQEMVETSRHLDLSLLQSVFEASKEEMAYGLSTSTYHTLQYLHQGKSIKEIAKLKEIKEATVQEHLIEIAIVIKDFPRKKYINLDRWAEINKLLDKDLFIRYKDARKRVSHLEFIDFRLCQIERIHHGPDLFTP